jgi:hypothetical protein
VSSTNKRFKFFRLRAGCLRALLLEQCRSADRRGVWLVLNIKRLRDSGRSARFVVQLMSAWLFAGGSLLAGSLKLIGR